MTEAIGWTSSVVLLATILSQIIKQWRERSAKGVSTLLFFGQIAASLGFTVYSILLANWVFTITNALMLLSAVCGLILTLHFKRAEAS